MGSTSVEIAIAGGTGAFVGAAVGQAVQWFRDLRADKILDRRRAEDAELDLAKERRALRRTYYLDTLTFLEDLARALRSLVTFSTVATHGPDNAALTAVMNEGRARVAGVTRDGLGAATARANIAGSSDLRQSFVDLNSSMAGYGAGEPTEKREVIDQVAWDAELERNGIRNWLQYTETRPLTTLEIAQGIHGVATINLAKVTKIIDLMRDEIGLG